MYPVLFHFGGFRIYSYGFMIACGAILGVSYLAIRGKKELGLSFDQANILFLLIFVAAFVGGKIFLFFEDPTYYMNTPAMLVKGSGFVFYGSFLLAIPTMLWFFRRNSLDVYKMLDIMAITTCIVHICGRIGCFLAGCCYGIQTDSILGVIFKDPACQAQPRNVPLYPTQLFESCYIFLVLLLLVYIRERRMFYGQLFLLYLILYGIGRSVLELLRGDEERGYIIKNVLSYAQFTALIIIFIASILYLNQMKRKGLTKKES